MLSALSFCHNRPGGRREGPRSRHSELSNDYTTDLWSQGIQCLNSHQPKPVTQLFTRYTRGQEVSQRKTGNGDEHRGHDYPGQGHRFSRILGEQSLWWNLRQVNEVSISGGCDWSKSVTLWLEKSDQWVHYNEADSGTGRESEGDLNRDCKWWGFPAERRGE